MKVHLRRAGAWLTFLLLAVALTPAAFARGFIDLTRDSTLTVTYDCPGIEFRLYKVADVSEAGGFTLFGNFANTGVKLDNKSDEEWQAAADTLDACASQYEPLERKTTGADGTLTFEPKKPGLYLVTWSQHTTDGYTYTPQPFLVCLPGLDKGDDWVYQVTADPKSGKVPDQPDPTPTTVDREVLKVWKDNGDTQNRPSSVTVLLLRDGKVYDEVTLNEGNHWKYQWTDLDAKYNWQVVEKEVPDGYTVTVRKNGATFVVTNTLTPPSPPDEPDNPPDDPDVPDEPDNPPDNPDVPDAPDVPNDPDTPDTPSRPDTPAPHDEPDIPQTGQLWWPVPLLACGGMGLFLAGWLKRRNSDCGETDE